MSIVKRAIEDLSNKQRNALIKMKEKGFDSLTIFEIKLLCEYASHSRMVNDSYDRNRRHGIHGMYC